VQHRVDHAADGLGSSHGRDLLGGPHVDRLNLFGLQANTDKLSGFGRPLSDRLRYVIISRFGHGTMIT